MKKITIFGLLFVSIILIGCDKSHNFMDVDNPNAKEDLINFIGTGNIPKINTENIIPEKLSGTLDTARGYANQYYEDTLQEYVNIARQGLSGAAQDLKGYYNSGVDELNRMVNDKVTGVISGELNKFKIK